MPGEELSGMPPAPTAETQTAAQPAEAPVLPQAPAVEHAGLLKRILNRFLNPMGKPKPTEMPTVSDSQTETPPPQPPLTARDASLPPLPQSPPSAS